MKLFDLEEKKFASRALKESFDYNFNPSKLNKVQTQTMLTRVKKALAETKKSPTFYKQQNNASYLKLLFMEEALSDHYVDLQKQRTRVVVENEEVEKSQVILAAQDMVDTIQKMLEDVGQMQVKELPALVSSIESEMDVQKAQQFNDSVGQQLTTLAEALKASFDGVKGSLNSLTGMEGASAMDFDTAAGEAGDLAMDAGQEMGADMGAEMGADMAEPMPAEEPEQMPTGGVGRAKR